MALERLQSLKNWHDYFKKNSVRVLRRGGYSFAQFWEACWVEYMKCFGERRAVPVATEV